MHTSPALFSGKFIPPFSMLLIGLIALLVKCWDLLLQRFETASCNVYLPDIAEITCFCNTWSTSASRRLVGSGLGLREGADTPPNREAEGQSIKDPERGGCPAPVEIIMCLFMAYLYRFGYNCRRIRVHLRVLGTSEFPPHVNTMPVREEKTTPGSCLTCNLRFRPWPWEFWICELYFKISYFCQ